LKRLIFAIIVLTALIGLLVVPAGADTGDTQSQTWYLDDSAGAHGGTYKMLREDTGVSGNSITIPAGGSITWLSDEPAGAKVTFPSGAWAVNISTDKNWDHAYVPYDPKKNYKPKCHVEIGGESTGLFVTIPSTLAYMKGSKIILDSETVSIPESINKGDYLYLTVYNDDNIPHVVNLNGDSNLVSPNSDPGFPLPEVTTAVLLGGTLLGLAGFMVIRQKRKTSSTKT
jgi:hypothetical protein